MGLYVVSLRKNTQGISVIATKIVKVLVEPDGVVRHSSYIYFCFVLSIKLLLLSIITNNINYEQANFDRLFFVFTLCQRYRTGTSL
jgi:hypothetical protein